MIAKVLFWFLPAQLVLAPIALGGNRPWVHGLFAVLVFVPTLLALLAWAFKKFNPPEWNKSRQIFLAALLLLAIYFELQANPIFGWSINPANTAQQASLTWIYFAFSLSCCLLVHNRQQAQVLVWAVVITGFVQALLGIVLFSAGAGYVFGGEPIGHSVVKGTFVGRNNFATLMNISLCTGIGLMLHQIAQARPALGVGFKKLLRAMSLFFLSAKAPLRVMLMVMVIALIASRSRAANSLFFMASVGLGLLAMWLFANANSSAKKSVRFLFITVLVIDVVVMGTVVGLDKLIERIENTRVQVSQQQQQSNNLRLEDSPNQYSDSLQGRVAPALNGLNAVYERSLLGWGGRTFEYVFTPYENASSTVEHYEHAHSDPVEILIDAGLVGATLYLVVLCVPIIAGVLPLINTSRRIQTRALQLGLIFAVLLTVAHSTVDFPFQIFGVVLPFVAVLNLLMMSELPSNEQIHRRSRSA